MVTLSIAVLAVVQANGIVSISENNNDDHKVMVDVIEVIIEQGETLNAKGRDS